MTKNEVLAAINSNPALKGLEVRADARRPIVEVYGFNKTADWKATKAILEGMGFDCMPNNGMIICDDDAPEPTLRERYERMTPEQRAAADQAWANMGGHIKQREEYDMECPNCGLAKLDNGGQCPLCHGVPLPDPDEALRKAYSRPLSDIAAEFVRRREKRHGLYEDNAGHLFLVVETDGGARGWSGLEDAGRGMFREDVDAALEGDTGDWTVPEMSAEEIERLDATLIATYDGHAMRLHNEPGRAAREYIGEPATYQVGEAPEYWGPDCKPEWAQELANDLAQALQVFADREGLDVEIGTAERQDTSGDLETIEQVQREADRLFNTSPWEWVDPDSNVAREWR